MTGRPKISLAKWAKDETIGYEYPAHPYYRTAAGWANPSGSAGPEITPEMIQAGLRVLWASGLVEVEDQAHGSIVGEILEAALESRLSAKRKSPSQ